MSFNKPPTPNNWERQTDEPENSPQGSKSKEPIENLKDDITEKVIHGKWHDSVTIDLFRKWKQKNFENLYDENTKLDDSEISDIYQKKAEDFLTELALKIPIPEDREIFLDFMYKEGIL